MMTNPEQSYFERIAKVRSTWLGYADHGIFTAYLHLDYGGSGQSAGGYALDDKPTEGRGKRRGTAFGMEWIIRAMSAAGVGRWEDVAGRTLIALFAPGDEYGQVIGLKPLPTEPGELFIFADLKGSSS